MSILKEKFIELFTKNEIEFMNYLNKVTDAAISGDAFDKIMNRIEFTVNFLIANGATIQARGQWYDIKEYNNGEKAVATCSNCHERGEVRTKRTESGLWVLNSPCCPNCGAAMNLPKSSKTDVHCWECERLTFSDCYGECGKGYKGIVRPNDTCGHGIRKSQTES